MVVTNTLYSALFHGVLRSRPLSSRYGFSYRDSHSKTGTNAGVMGDLCGLKDEDFEPRCQM